MQVRYRSPRCVRERLLGGEKSGGGTSGRQGMPQVVHAEAQLHDIYTLGLLQTSRVKLLVKLLRWCSLFEKTSTPRAARMLSLLVPALLLAAEQPPTSMLPLSDQLLLKHFGETAPPANSGYGAEAR